MSGAFVIGRYTTALLTVAVLMSGCGDEQAAPPGSGSPGSVGVELRTAQPSYAAGALPVLSIVLRNDGGDACSLPSTAAGTVEILSVRLDDVTLIGAPGRTYYYDGIEAEIATGLRKVAAGASVVVPLNVARNRGGAPRITSTVGTDSGAGTTTTWPLDQPGEYRITASLAPLPQDSSTCASTGATADVQFEVSR